MLLPLGVQIGEPPHVLWRNPDGVDPDRLAAQISHTWMGNPDGVALDNMACPDILHSDISQPNGRGGRSMRRHFTSGYLTAGWERRTLQLLRIDISRPSDNAYQESFSLSIQCSGVLLKLPDIFD